MKQIKKKVVIRNFDIDITIYQLFHSFNSRIKFIFENIKYSCFISSSLLLIFIIIVEKFYYQNIIDLKPFKKYVRDCKKLNVYERIKVFNDKPYLSVCIPSLNMEKYIGQNILSILNQSFQNFDIIIVNDASTDETENIILKMQLNDRRIKLLSHSKKLGVYRSRIESILNSKSKYIILMDPDDMYLNENLFLNLFHYNLEKNLDIIEFSVYQQIDGSNQIFFPDNDFETHYHRFNKNIIYQPELSEILYFLPGTNEYSHTICRNIWNKMIRTEIFIQVNDYLGTKYYQKNIITSDDMIMNVVSYQYANNYSNNQTKYKRVQQNLLKQILKENTLTNEFETYLQNLSIYLKI